MSKEEIENKIGVSIKDMILGLESCIRVGKEVCNSEEHYSVQITDWDAEHLLAILTMLR